MFRFLRVTLVCLVLSGVWGCGDSNEIRYGYQPPTAGATPPARLLALSISPSSLTLAYGTSAQLRATGSFSDGSRRELTEDVLWTSSQPSVAEVESAGGRVLGLSPGVATITASLAGRKATSTVTVSDATVQSLELTPTNLTLAAGTSGSLVARGLFSDGTVQDLSSQAVWSSSNPAVASHSDQTLVRGLTAGTATITATVGEYSASAEVQVTNAVLTTISLSPSTATLAAGTTLDLKATGTFSDGSTQELSEVLWSSSSDAVASVRGGSVLGLSTGQTVVSARVGDIVGGTTVTVTPAVLRSLAVTPSTVRIPKGSSTQFVATGTFSDGSQRDLSSQVVWTSSSPSLSIFNVPGSSGLAVALNIESNVVVTAALDGIEAKATAEIGAAVLQSIAIIPTSPTLVQRETRQLRATGILTDGTTQDLSSAVAWSSGTESVARVSLGGVLTGRINPGVATGQSVISATFGGLSGSTTATVASRSGAAYAAGTGSQGQLGTGTTASSRAPVAVGPVSLTFSVISAGLDHGVGLAGDGRAYAWGMGSYGRLGTGSTSNALAPQLVVAGAIPAGVTLVEVAAGAYHTVALGSDAKVYAWGLNTNGQLGDGTNTNSSSPVAVNLGGLPAGTTFVAIAAGDYHSLALASNGSLYSWGWNVFGQLGDGANTSRSVPGLVAAGALPAGSVWVEISSEGNHALGLASDGNVYAWGDNGYGQLGSTGVGTSNLPRAVSQGAVPTGVKLTAIAAGTYHSLATGSDGKLYAWGDNLSSQLGTGGSPSQSSTPVAVLPGAVPAGVRFTAISAGYYHSLALGSDGKLYSWGENFDGQAGTGSAGINSSPVLAGNLGEVTPGVPVTLFSAGGQSFFLSIP